MPGTKEAYGISIIREDLRVGIPPRAFERYRLKEDGFVVLITGHRGKSGFGLLNRETIDQTVFAGFVQQIEETETVCWFKEKAYTISKLLGRQLSLRPEFLEAYYLTVGNRLLVIKSTTVTMSFTPVDIWKASLARQGFSEAIKNMDLLEEF